MAQSSKMTRYYVISTFRSGQYGGSVVCGRLQASEQNISTPQTWVLAASVPPLPFLAPHSPYLFLPLPRPTSTFLPLDSRTGADPEFAYTDADTFVDDRAPRPARYYLPGSSPASHADAVTLCTGVGSLAAPFDRVEINSMVKLLDFYVGNGLVAAGTQFHVALTLQDGSWVWDLQPEDN